MMIDSKELADVLNRLISSAGDDPDEYDLGWSAALDEVWGWLENRMTEAGEGME